jgi:hypothetical protein
MRARPRSLLLLLAGLLLGSTIAAASADAAAGFESSPVVAGGVVFVGKGPASGVPVDAGVYAFDARGCGAAVCLPLSLTQLGPDQFYLGSSIAVTGGRVMLGSNDNTDGHSNLSVLALGP